jgi:large subunit ribosomal protein L25
MTLPEHELMLALKTPNVLIRLEGLAGRPALALPKAVQRHAIKNVIEHVDLIEVRSGEKVTVEIPIRVTGEVFSGGILDQQLVQISVEAEATHLPDGVDVDVEGAAVGTQVFAKDLTLPEGTALAGDPEALVLHVTAPQSQAQFDAELGETAETADAPVAEAAAE